MIRVIDIETCGVNPGDGICEIGWSDVSQGADGGWYASSPIAALVDPGKAIPPEVSAVHHITNEDVKGAPSLHHALGDDTAWPRISAYAAHRSSFEQSFLADVPLFKVAPWICTWKVALRLAPNAPSHNNQALRYWLGLDLDRGLAMPPHRAGPDAYVTAHILRRMLAKLSVEEMIKISAEPAILPKFTFGKHAMKPLAEVPSDYLEWMTRQQDMDADARATAAHHLKLRAA